jgi:hypothetical protein
MAYANYIGSNAWRRKLSSMIDRKHLNRSRAQAGVRCGMGAWRPQNVTLEAKQIE